MAVERAYIEISNDGREGSSKGTENTRRPTKEARFEEMDRNRRTSCLLPVSIESVLQQSRISPAKPLRRSKAPSHPEIELPPHDRAQLESLILDVINTADPAEIQRTLHTVGAKRAAYFAGLADEEGEIKSFRALTSAGFSARMLNSLVLVRPRRSDQNCPSHISSSTGERSPPGICMKVESGYRCCAELHGAVMNSTEVEDGHAFPRLRTNAGGGFCVAG